jgi:23S rRNA pseudouridine2605 synthase
MIDQHKTIKIFQSDHRLPSHDPKVGLSRALSKLGHCSRKQAQALIQEGRVRVSGIIQKDLKTRIDLGCDPIEVDDQRVILPTPIYLMLNKPRGIVTTSSDEKGRETVYECLKKENLPWVSPVGRLDKASEGLLLFTNDTEWASGILDPANHLEKIYHVQIDRLADDVLLHKMMKGAKADGGELLRAKQVKFLRRGIRNCWLEVILDEGKNREIRRLLSALSVNVLRLVRVAIGPVKLGNLAKGDSRFLTVKEKNQLQIKILGRKKTKPSPFI